MKIELGTVQFGIPYGIANSKGQVEKKEAKNILDYAKSSGINSIDTAIAYGTSEKCLGEIGLDGFQVITKLPKIPDNYGNLKSWVQKHIKNSLSTLSVESLSGLLLHRPSQLLDSDKNELWSILLRLKDEGLVKKIGFSIYTPSELDDLWNLYKPDLIQAPYSIFDRRLDSSGWLSRLKKSNTQIHIRSVFLQGLLLMDVEARPEYFSRWQLLFDKYDSWLADSPHSAIEICIGFIQQFESVEKIIVGIASLFQLEDIINACSNNALLKVPSDFCSDDIELINPAKWSL